MKGEIRNDKNKGRIRSSNFGINLGRSELAVQPDYVPAVAGTGREEGGLS